WRLVLVCAGAWVGRWQRVSAPPRAAACNVLDVDDGAIASSLLAATPWLAEHVDDVLLEELVALNHESVPSFPFSLTRQPVAGLCCLFSTSAVRHPLLSSFAARSSTYGLLYSLFTAVVQSSLSVHLRSNPETASHRRVGWLA